MKIHILTIIIALVFASCNTEKEESHYEEEHNHSEEGTINLNKKQRDALSLKLGSFQMRNLTTVIKTNGQLEVSPENRADITTLIGGNVKEIKVFHGDKVSKGQVLAILEHPDFIAMQESYAEFANSLEYLEQEYNRQKELFNSKAGSGKEYQKAKANYFTAKAKYQGLRSRLLLMNLSPERVKEGHISNVINLISPINGYVNEIFVKLGTYVGPQDKLFEIIDNTAIHADFMVYEKDIFLLEKGQKIHFTVANRPNDEFLATVFAIGKAFDNNSRAIHIHATIDGDTKGLIPGMYISGHLHTDENYAKTLPNDAIVKEGTKNFIFVVNEEHTHSHEMEDGDENHEGHSNDNSNETEHKHEPENVKEGNISFRMVEVIIGKSDDGYTEVHLVDSLDEDVKIVMNAAYYLLSDMKKEETEHKH
jgi:cobalt-zinc-cadmium efflux system membrane fusion protein